LAGAHPAPVTQNVHRDDDDALTDDALALDTLTDDALTLDALTDDTLTLDALTDDTDLLDTLLTEPMQQYSNRMIGS